jgi:hypothetical protein
MKWSAELPGRGVSSPIVVGDRIFVTCYSGYGVSGREESIENLVRHVVCVSRNEGKVLWQRDFKVVLPEDPYRPPGVTSHGYASNTPVSDGKRVFAFLGKSGVVALDLDGNELWKVDVGHGSGPQAWGSAASPVVHESLLIVPAIEESEALIAFDTSTGKEVWRSAAESYQGTWGTPVIATANGQTDIVVCVPHEVWGINPATGKLRWYSRGTTDDSASTSPVVGEGIVYAIGGRGGDAVAVKLGGKGDVNKTHVAWDANIPGRFATPIFYQGHLYNFTGGVIECYNAATGERVKQQRLPQSQPNQNANENRPPGGDRGSDGGGRGFGGPGGRRGGMGSQDYASPVLAGDLLYVTTKSGTVHVVRATPELELVASNAIADSTGFDATPAIADGQLFLRSGSRLYCIASSGK